MKKAYKVCQEIQASQAYQVLKVIQAIPQLSQGSLACPVIQVEMVKWAFQVILDLQAYQACQECLVAKENQEFLGLGFLDHLVPKVFQEFRDLQELLGYLEEWVQKALLGRQASQDQRESQDLRYLGHLDHQDSQVSKEHLVQKVIVVSQDLQVPQDALDWMDFLDQKVILDQMDNLAQSDLLGCQELVFRDHRDHQGLQGQ